MLDLPLDTYRNLRKEIASVIEDRGWSPEREGYTATLDGDEVDAMTWAPNKRPVPVSWISALRWGFAATVVLTGILTASQGLR